MRLVFMLLMLGMLTACTTTRQTVDDGRKVNEALVANIRAYGAGEQVLRPAIVRSSALKDAECDTQWELPFSVATSYDENEDDRIAWVRALGVDERLTVIAAASDSPLKPGDKIRKIGALGDDNTEQMMLLLAKMRDQGAPFNVTLSSKKTMRVVPLQVCRGYTRLAPPKSPQVQDYHWSLSVHPLDVVRVGMTEDEALWLVLWGQGVSEVGGARMKTYHYGKETIGTLFTLFTIASGIQAAALASEAALSVVKSTVTSYATDLIRDQLLDQVQKRMSQQQVMNAMQRSAANRKSLKGVAWVASTMFEEADAWAYERMERLNANPLAAFTLHQKLIERSYTANTMVLDPERFKALNKRVEDQGRGEEVVAILQGIRPEDLHFDVVEMPVASSPAAFSYEESGDLAADQPFAHGLVDGMMQMPVSSTLPN